jgi:predicted nucleic acid-binding protein
MNSVGLGRYMIVVDASCLYELVTEGARADSVRDAMLIAEDLAAPELIDVEVLGLIRRDSMNGVLHDSRAGIAMNELMDWPGHRFSLRPFTQRAWDLRFNVRSWDAYYVALAEFLQVPLLTLDQRLVKSEGPTCSFIVPGLSV